MLQQVGWYGIAAALIQMALFKARILNDSSRSYFFISALILASVVFISARVEWHVDTEFSLHIRGMFAHRTISISTITSVTTSSTLFPSAGLRCGAVVTTDGRVFRVPSVFRLRDSRFKAELERLSVTLNVPIDLRAGYR
jgi:hypothetical protein